jgi:NTE family protein
MLEALDELDTKPRLVAGSSIGAAIGAAFAAGLSGKDIRRHVVGLVHDRGDVFRRMMAARTGGFATLLRAPLGNPLLIDAEKFCAAFLPPDIPETFEELALPLRVVTTDYYGRVAVAFDSGPLRPALAASMAVPGLVRPVRIGERVLVDGAAADPLPFDGLRGLADFVVAIDTSIGPSATRGVPEPWEALFSTIQLMGHALVAEKLKAGAPEIIVRPNVGASRLLDFLQASAVLRAAAPAKEELKAKLAAMLEG